MNELKARQKAKELINNKLVDLVKLSKETGKSIPTIRKIRNDDHSVSLDTIVHIINQLK